MWWPCLWVGFRPGESGTPSWQPPFQTGSISIERFPRVSAAQEAYAGRVRKDIDHEALKPAAWRIDALQVGT